MFLAGFGFQTQAATAESYIICEIFELPITWEAQRFKCRSLYHSEVAVCFRLVQEQARMNVVSDMASLRICVVRHMNHVKCYKLT